MTSLFTNKEIENLENTINNRIFGNEIKKTKETLKNYASTLEEGRADLVGLYYLYNPKLQELGLVTDWKAVGMAAFDGYIRNGLMTQLIRLNLGDDVEEAHMRNRQWVSAWAYEKGLKDNVIEKLTRDGKTYFNINDYEKLHDLFGQLLRETQRIKSEGDFAAVQDLVEGYGVKVDQVIHAEVLERNKQFKSAAYGGFVNPVLVSQTDSEGAITSIDVKYVESFVGQLLITKFKNLFFAVLITSSYILFFNHIRNFLNKGTKGTIVSITANIPMAWKGIPVNLSISFDAPPKIQPTIVNIRGFCFNCSTNVKCGLFTILINYFIKLLNLNRISNHIAQHLNNKFILHITTK